ncbi:MFS transporter [Leucobacter sp. UT-8R-CII-1-4]|uniref:MFS transporter n=1 Tax=Leucobacter sp. UT-8R-CII-1-4 TaxID=3040075 RepID=UPI0024A8E195|nr:MFS transporter [Leucobacter sp. UT-8R-CII-1-4]MDI6022384.1 MFS transporter [Leucobacter sp. UT-8R-CII-1-4]
MTSHEQTRRTNAPHTASDSWWPLIACSLGTFLLLLYTSIATVALPDIGTGLAASYTQLQWVVDIYTLALAGLLLGAGSIGDAFGARLVYLIGIAVFTAATLAAGLAQTPEWLIAARGAQGVAGAAMFATIPALIARAYPEPARRAIAFAVWGAVAGAASAVGTVAGGVLTQFMGWQWLFLGAVPLCLFSLLLIAKTLPSEGPETRSTATAKSLDWPGMATVSIAMASCVYAVISASEVGWGSPRTLAAFAMSAVAWCGFAFVERGARSPILPGTLLRSASFLMVLLTAFAYYFAAFGALPALALWLHHQLGVDAMTVSLILVSQLLVFIVASALLSHRFTQRSIAWRLGAPLLLIGLGAASGFAANGWNDWWALLPFLLLSGVGAGLISPALPQLALDSAPSGYAAAASSAPNAARQLGLALGVAVCGVLARDGSSGALGSALLSCAAIAVCAGIAVCFVGARGGKQAGALDQPRLA